MISGLLGKKVGMTQVFGEGGCHIPVTVLQAGPCVVMQVKSSKTDGYNALQLGFQDRRRKTVTRAAQGVARKAGTEPKRFIREVGWDGADEVKAGQPVTLDTLEGVFYVDVSGIMKGRGFAGVMKRHGFAGGSATHGQSDRPRAPGSIGRQCSISKGVPKGKRMPGHMGSVPSTAKNLAIVQVDKGNNVLVVKGAVPGPNGGFVIIRRSAKVPPKVEKPEKGAKSGKK
ncbi:MAG: 50S ribosomal protein L3 [Planctomycetota bacterium]